MPDVRSKYIRRFTLMFVVDLLTAFLLAIVFTFGFAAFVRTRGYHSWREMPLSIWILNGVSWIAGILLVALGAIPAHWLSFGAAVAALGAMTFLLVRSAGFRRALSAPTGSPGNDARPAIAFYFCITLLLFFCAVSIRFYIVNLS
ncbi:MAG TPA: hypothetical protein VJ719_14425 [Chthoniobacterales bacterium]|nr:hypothetical protein [Chthoniobacterales bacterium]